MLFRDWRVVKKEEYIDLFLRDKNCLAEIKAMNVWLQWTRITQNATGTQTS